MKQTNKQKIQININLQTYQMSVHAPRTYNQKYQNIIRNQNIIRKEREQCEGE